MTNDRTYMMDEEILVSSSNEWCKYIKWGADEFWDSHGIYIDQVHHLFHSSYRSRRFISSHVNVPYAFSLPLFSSPSSSPFQPSTDSLFSILRSPFIPLPVFLSSCRSFSYTVLANPNTSSVSYKRCLPPPSPASVQVESRVSQESYL